MKYYLAPLAALAAAVSSSAAHAQITVSDPRYAVAPYYTHTNSDTIVSYDFVGGGAFYYQTAVLPSYTFGGLYRATAGGAPTVAAPGSTAQFSGASVVTAGQYVYYNTSSFTSQLIYRYDTQAGAATQVSTASNYGLYANGNRLFITAAPDFTTNHFYYSAINPANGALTNPVDLGPDTGASGPLAFDPQGNLYYAPGDSRSIYRFSKTDVDQAIANPAGNFLGAAGHLWLDYSGDADFTDLAGGTSMLVGADGSLLLTITNFSNRSALARFGVAGNGAYDGTTDAILDDAGLLGELRLAAGSLLVSEGNRILQVVPEPAAAVWLILGGAAALRLRRRRA